MSKYNDNSPHMVNAATIAQLGFCDLGSVSATAVSPLLADWLTQSTADSNGNPSIDMGQAQLFLDHMIRKLGLCAEDLIYMRVFLERNQRMSSDRCDNYQKQPQGLRLLYSAYLAQTVQFDEPLSKNVWMYYSKMSWDGFLDELMKFTVGLGFDLSVSAEVWNRAAETLLEPILSPVYMRSIFNQGHIEQVVAVEASHHHEQDASAVVTDEPEEMEMDEVVDDRNMTQESLKTVNRVPQVINDSMLEPNSIGYDDVPSDSSISLGSMIVQQVVVGWSRLLS